jgi:Carbamoyl-phosphate synthase L chain, ATP binding domain
VGGSYLASQQQITFWQALNADISCANWHEPRHLRLRRPIEPQHLSGIEQTAACLKDTKDTEACQVRALVDLAVLCYFLVSELISGHSEDVTSGAIGAAREVGWLICLPISIMLLQVVPQGHVDARSNVKPAILLLAAEPRWFSPARLAISLVNAGFTVQAVCPRRHPLYKTTAVQQFHTYRGLAPLMIANAISAVMPDVIIPCDDAATLQLHELYVRALHRGPVGQPTCSLLERSLGAPANFAALYERTTSMELAHEQGVQVPNCRVVANTEELRNCIAQMAFPIVLKSNRSSGGSGISIVHTVDEASRALRTLQSAPLLARAVKQTLIYRDSTRLWPSIRRERGVVNVQEFVPGHDATSAIVCWKGAVLAGLHFEVLERRHEHGPSTVLRVIDNAEMTGATEKMARRLQLSGVYGFDFMLHAQSGRAYLLEINPRATQVGHLTLGPGRDLPAALYAAITSRTPRPAPKITENDTIALFPQEWHRNPTSHFLRTAYHDVPWEEPELVRACLRISGKQAAIRKQNSLRQAKLRALNAADGQ